MPAVVKACEGTTERSVQGVNPDEVVTVGAAIQVILAGDVKGCVTSGVIRWN